MIQERTIVLIVAIKTRAYGLCESCDLPVANGDLRLQLCGNTLLQEQMLLGICLAVARGAHEPIQVKQLIFQLCDLQTRIVLSYSIYSHWQ